MMAARATPVLRASYQGAPVQRAVPSALPQQAKARLHSQWSRLVEQYDHAWVFDVGDDPPDDDEVQSYIDACDGMPAQWEAMKTLVLDGELTVMVRTGNPKGNDEETS